MSKNQRPEKVEHFKSQIIPRFVLPLAMIDPPFDEFDTPQRYQQITSSMIGKRMGTGSKHRRE
jgi:hypothetical protein